MASAFSDDFKEQVRTRTDLASLVGESLSLTPQRGGNEYVGLCPFHEDHTPSLRIYPDRQTYRCWVCDEGGDCFSWVMQKDGVGFREALEMLAERANLEIPKNLRQQSQVSGQKKADLYEILSWAENEFHRCLLDYPVAAKARDYLKGRGFTDEMIVKFRMGYHPDDWSWILNRARDRFSLQQLFASRLICKRKDGDGYFDYFVDRAMFPIRDERGRTVAFGGRVLPGHEQKGQGKYFNSVESAVFFKSKTLYGLDAARDAIRDSKTVAVVEGYTDCITCHQYGIENVVATLGTALTETHVTALKRFAPKVVLVYDGDDAGQMAAERALVKLLSQDIDLRVLTLPGGMDPADFLEAEGADALRTKIDQAVEAWEYKLRAEIARFGTDSIDASQKVLGQMLELLSQSARMAGSEREDFLLSKLAQKLQVPEQTIRKRLAEVRRRNSKQQSAEGNWSDSYRRDEAEENQRPVFRSEQLTTNDLLEAELLEIIFTAPKTAAAIKQQIDLTEIKQTHFYQLLETCYSMVTANVEPTFDRVTTEQEDPDLKRAAVWIDIQARDKQIEKQLNDVTVKNGSDVEQTYLEHAIGNVKWRQLKQTHERSKGQLAQNTDAPADLDQDARALLRQATEFHRKRTQKKTLT